MVVVVGDDFNYVSDDGDLTPSTTPHRLQR